MKTETPVRSFVTRNFQYFLLSRLTWVDENWMFWVDTKLENVFMCVLVPKNEELVHFLLSSEYLHYSWKFAWVVTFFFVYICLYIFWHWVVAQDLTVTGHGHWELFRSQIGWVFTAPLIFKVFKFKLFCNLFWCCALFRSVC